MSASQRIGLHAPHRRQGSAVWVSVRLTFGAALVIEESIRLIWGTRDYVLAVPPTVSGGFIFLKIHWVNVPLLAPPVLSVVCHRVWSGCWIEKTPFGAMIKAGAHDSEIVRALGINLTRLRLVRLSVGGTS